MISDIPLPLLRATVLTSFASILVLLVRRPLRHWVGAAIAYKAWLIVPSVTIIALLPGAVTPVVRLSPALQPMRILASQPMPITAAPLEIVLVLWVSGAAVMAGWFIAAHYAFLRDAGRLTLCDGLYVSAGDAGPASLGIVRPRIIVPHDFTQRYSAAEQALIVAHEQIHIERRDALTNLVAAIVQCVFWFNPLCHYAAHCLRQDQEIACDALVMARFPHQRRAYGHALLKSHAGHSAPYVGIVCHWKSFQPTKERIMHLQSASPGMTRRIVGRTIVTMLAAGAIVGAFGVRAEQLAAAPAYDIAMTIDAGAEHAAPRVLSRADDPFAVASGAWRMEFTVRPAGTASAVWIAGKIVKNDRVLSTPTLRVRIGEKATLKTGEGTDAVALSMVVSMHR